MSTRISTNRNLTMELYKMVAAYAVVLLHVPFPGDISPIAAALCQFANPTFFAITGYFNYRATDAQLRRRFRHIADLYITAWVVHLLYSCITVELDGGSTIAYLRAAVPDLNELFWWFSFQQDSFLAQLWFLASTGLCYLLLWGYTRFAEKETVNYRTLYLCGFSLFSLWFLMSIVMPVSGTEVNFYWSRNGWFFGIPFFLLGLFLHEHQEKIRRCFPTGTLRQWLMILGGCVLCVLQVRAGISAGFPIGTFLVVLGLMLFGGSHPGIPWLPPRVQRLVARFGVWSSGIYLFHVTIMLAYERFLLVFFQERLGDSEPYLRSILIWTISLLVAILWDQACRIIRKFLKKA